MREEENHSSVRMDFYKMPILVYLWMQKSYTCRYLYGKYLFFLTVTMNNFIFQVTNDFYLAELIKFILWLEKEVVLQFTDTETIKIDWFC